MPQVGIELGTFRSSAYYYYRQINVIALALFFCQTFLPTARSAVGLGIT
jgi:hypothetical protein